MTDEQESQPEEPGEQQGHQPQSILAGCLAIGIKFVIGVIVLVIVAIALVFGVCWLGV